MADVCVSCEYHGWIQEESGLYPLNPGAVSDRQIALNPPLSRSQSEDVLSPGSSAEHDDSIFQAFRREEHLSTRLGMKKSTIFI